MKTAIVTGGSRGIGRATAELLTLNGYKVYFTYSSENTDTDALITGFDSMIPVKCDVSDEQAMSLLFSRIADESGRLDIAVCNAGVSLFGQFTYLTSKEWDEIFAINTRGVFLTAKYSASAMLKKHYGSIITVSSIWGQTGASCEAAYSASKAAVIGFTKAIAKELAPSGITANCICPGVIDTAMNSALDDNTISALCEEIPLGRIGTPHEVAKAIFDIATNPYITGQVLSVNGGMYI